MWTVRTKLGWGLMMALVVLLVLASVRYFTMDPDVYFPRQRAVYEAHTVGLFVHIAAMMVGVLVGPFQFLRALRNRHPRVHRFTGRVYIASATIGALAGLYMAQFAASGWVAGLGFAFLAVGVLVTTLRAFYRFQTHREWMTRSYALMLAAVTLRLEVPILEVIFGEYAGYAMVAWLCWVPNLLVAEWLIQNHLRKSPEFGRAGSLT